MTIKVWFRWMDGYQKQAADEIVDRLHQQDIDVHDYDNSFSCMAGVMFSNEVTPKICKQLRELSRNGQIAVLACCNTTITGDAVWQLLEAGACDVLVSSQDNTLIHEIIARLQRWGAVHRLVNSPVVQNVLVGESQVLKAILRQVVEVAHFTDASVLILGESGTGKELLANLVHALDPRANKGNLVIQDCTTIVPELSGSEFFGHERGAFTGAVSSRDGVFALANGGTLFLDEVGELPLTLQAQLLRVIQEHTFKRVGGNTWQQTSFRLICATNRDLCAQVQRGEFRADLYYRIASYVCHLPPLRERPEDILPLANHFLKVFLPNQGPPELDALVQEYLLRHEYPGNVRDLKQVVARMLCHYAGQGAITVGCIPPEDRPNHTGYWSTWCDGGFERAIRVALTRGVNLKTISRESKNVAIRIAVNEASGNLQKAAQRLGVTDRALQMRRAAQRQENF
ncbi:sigma 54-interacting transcriptional regulator [Nitrosomonas sp. Nm34]|uniref:sigma 54-interacting transcriptional regulator n=1 Tax=Nitrosomonas sp. Nm34 TaxID=1881055 RepID=UPI0008E9B6FC|nr:sigma-54 dependent transcriptional regulator [Nitrosomonas sp. Nm34]SFI42179.1 DNA-binding transcriptional response regulator, NtrC family, contains REC, AAA-type ATPase, and a Fis-type DNA-binding domains [Nitrosomonas sp. Nm34]